MSTPKLADQLRFPSGLTVSSARQRAKKLHRTSHLPLRKCYDIVAHENGSTFRWSKALQQMLATSMQRVSATPMRMTVADIETLSNRNPALIQHGFDTVHLLWREELALERKSNQSLLPHCNLALAYISLFSPHHEINRHPDMASIELKHHAERALKLIRPERSNYIPQGAFIMAALHRGFLMAEGPGGLYGGAFFNIKPASHILEPSESDQKHISAQLTHHLGRLGVE